MSRLTERLDDVRRPGRSGHCGEVLWQAHAGFPGQQEDHRGASRAGPLGAAEGNQALMGTVVGDFFL